eukprot:SAG31_NODE_201_length_20535_cov_15.315081_5_plen_84_part_00
MTGLGHKSTATRCCDHLAKPLLQLGQHRRIAARRQVLATVACEQRNRKALLADQRSVSVAAPLVLCQGALAPMLETGSYARVG